MRTIEEILRDLKSRTSKGNINFYKPLSDEKEREAIYTHYLSTLTLPSEGSIKTVGNRLGTPIGLGYKRIVIGDYGSFIELTDTQIFHNNIEFKFNSIPTRYVKYIWMQTKDELHTKIYWQKGEVSYADYIPGCYYIDPFDAIILE